MEQYSWHLFIMRFLRIFAGPFVRLAMRYKVRKQKGPDKPAIIISNHNSDLDPALVAMGFSRHMYFLTSEHALRNGLPSKLLKFVFSPIPINKTQTDVQAIKEMLRRIKKGANICLFAEGDRSFSGRTSPLALSTAKLVKTSGADLITFRIEGGYFTTPRWSKTMRKGKMSGGIVNEYSAEKLKTMTDEETLAAIESDIYADAYDKQTKNPVNYRGKRLAENIETVLYLCPRCKRLGTIRSKGDRFFCGCGLSAIYKKTGFLEGESLPFSTITEWDIWQTEMLEEIINNAGAEQICADESQQLFEVNVTVGKTLIGEGAMQIDREAIRCAGKKFPLGQITRLAIVGQMTLLFATKDGQTYEVRSAAPRSALKYREVFRILTQG